MVTYEDCKRIVEGSKRGAKILRILEHQYCFVQRSILVNDAEASHLLRGHMLLNVRVLALFNVLLMKEAGGALGHNSHIIVRLLRLDRLRRGA